MSQLPHWAIKCGHQRRSHTPYHSATTTPLRSASITETVTLLTAPGILPGKIHLQDCTHVALTQQPSGTAAQQYSSTAVTAASKLDDERLPHCRIALPTARCLPSFFPQAHKVGSLSYPAFFDRLWLGWCRCQVRSPGRRPPYVARSAEEEISAGGLDGLLGEGDGSRVEGGWNVPGSTRGLLLQTGSDCSLF